MVVEAAARLFAAVDVQHSRIAAAIHAGAGPDRCDGPAAYTPDLDGDLDGEWVSDPFIVLTRRFPGCG